MGEKHAILIAVEKYHDRRIPPVKYAENDVAKLASALQLHNYLLTNTVVLVSSTATKTRLESALRTTCRALKSDDHLLIYYAGHGFSEKNQNYITCHDTMMNDLPLTSLSLASILTEIRSSACKQVVIFLDSCHSGLPIDTSMRGLIADMSDAEFKAFCEESEYHIAFAACRTDQQSHSSDLIKHGIWTYHVIEALEGNNLQALDRGKYLTTNSLQAFLSVEVPKTLRKSFTDKKNQTPHFWGTLSHDAILADFTAIFAKKAAEKRASLGELKKTSIYGYVKDSIKSLSGFIKRKHFVPDNIDDATRRFVHDIGEDDLKNHAEAIYSDLKGQFKYKRTDIELNLTRSSAEIFTPDFTVKMWLGIDEDEPSQYILWTEITDIENPVALMSTEFDSVFRGICDHIQLNVSGTIPVEDIIDAIEKNPDEGNLSITYLPSTDSCTVTIKSHNTIIQFDRSHLTLMLISGKSVHDLLNSYRQLPVMLSEQKIMELLPASTAKKHERR